MSNSSFYEAFEQRMRAVWTALEFWMSLGSFKVRMVFDFYGFYQTAIRAGAADDEACFFQFWTERIGYFCLLYTSPSPRD